MKTTLFITISVLLLAACNSEKSAWIPATVDGKQAVCRLRDYLGANITWIECKTDATVEDFQKEK